MRADLLNDDPVEARHGDIFLGVDWSADVVPSIKPWFLAQRTRGTKIFFVVYDLLPLVRPELFPEFMPGIALDWVSAIAEVADGVVCISRTVADELHEWLSAMEPPRLKPLSLGFFHLGADLDASIPTRGLSQDGWKTSGEAAKPSDLADGWDVGTPQGPLAGTRGDGTAVGGRDGSQPSDRRQRGAGT